MKVSIYDVAELAGVSISTVSRVMNKSGYVSHRTEEKVKKAMDTLNFVPNIVAQNLAKHETSMIGLYLPTLHDKNNINSVNTYYMEFVRGVQDVVMEKEYHLLLINEPKTIEEIRSESVTPQYWSFLKQKRVDGLIIGQAPVPSAAFSELFEQPSPFVYIGERIMKDRGINVYAQYKQYIEQSLDYFVLRGHRHLAVFWYDERMMKSVISGYQGRSNAQDIRIDYHQMQYSLESFLDSLAELYSQEDKPTALFIQDLNRIQPCINYLNNIGLRVPDDVSIITVEYTPDAGENCFPAVTSVYVPVYQMGFSAASLLFESLESDSSLNKEVLINSIIIERQTVAVKH